MTAIAASNTSAMPAVRSGAMSQSSQDPSDFASKQLEDLRKQRDSISGSKPNLWGNKAAIWAGGAVGFAGGIAAGLGVSHIAEKSAWYTKFPAYTQPEFKLIGIAVGTALVVGSAAAYLGGITGSKLTAPNAEETARRTTEHQQSVSQKLAVIDAQIREVENAGQ